MKRPAFRLHRNIPDIRHELGREAISLCAKKLAPDLSGNGGLVGFTQSSSGLDQRLQHRLEIEDRAADVFQYVGGRSLLLQRLAQFVEQAGILDGDDSLGGEVLDQLDLLVGEWANLLAIDRNGTDQLGFLEHRDDEERPNAPKFDGRGPQRIALNVCTFRSEIDDMYGLLRSGNPHDRGILVWPMRTMLKELCERLRFAERGDGSHSAVLERENITEFCFTYARRVLQHGLK